MCSTLEARATAFSAYRVTPAHGSNGLLTHVTSLSGLDACKESATCVTLEHE